MSNIYNVIGTPNADGTLKEFGNTSPKVESPTAVNVSFDNTGTSLQSDNAEDAIKEIDEKIGDTDISSIGDGTATGAISTINSNMTNKDFICAYDNSYENDKIVQFTVASGNLYILVKDKTTGVILAWKYVPVSDVQ